MEKSEGQSSAGGKTGLEASRHGSGRSKNFNPCFAKLLPILLSKLAGGRMVVFLGATSGAKQALI